jgi:CheY-like chemotaxis protein
MMEKSNKILVVDDDHQSALIIEKYLKKQGYLATSVTSAIEGGGILKKEPYDLVVTDLLMPEVNGLEFMLWINENSPRTKVIIVTSMDAAESDIKNFAEQKGVVKYLNKPVNLLELNNLIEKTLDGNISVRTSNYLGLLDYIKMLVFSREQKRIVVTDPINDITGAIYLNNGSIIDAQFDKLRGEDAFYKMVTLKTGIFIDKPWVEQTINIPFSEMVVNLNKKLLEATMMIALQPVAANPPGTISQIIMAETESEPSREVTAEPTEEPAPEITGEKLEEPLEEVAGEKTEMVDETAAAAGEEKAEEEKGFVIVQPEKKEETGFVLVQTEEKVETKQETGFVIVQPEEKNETKTEPKTEPEVPVEGVPGSEKSLTRIRLDRRLVAQAQALKELRNAKNPEKKFTIYESGVGLGIIVGETKKPEVLTILNDYSFVNNYQNSANQIFFYEDISVNVLFDSNDTVEEISFGSSYPGATSSGIKIGDLIDKALKLYEAPKICTLKGAIWDNFAIFCASDRIITSIKITADKFLG